MVQRSPVEYWNLLQQLVKVDFKLRFQGSALGIIWSFLRPLLLFGVLYGVFNVFVKIGASIENYALYLLIGIVLWSYIGEATKSGMSSIVRRADLIRKVYFPHVLIVIASSFNAWINLAISLVVVTIFAIFAQVGFSLGLLWLPFLLLELFVLTFGISMLLASLFVKFRDYQHLWDVILQAGFYATPILYPVDLAPLLWQKILLLSPAAQIFQDVRAIVISDQTIQAHEVLNGWHLLIPYALPWILLIFGTWLFFRRQRYFAEDV